MEKICKECGINKDLNDYYKHPQGVLGTLPRCKECIKKGRRTEREKIMARKRDIYRYHNDSTRNKKCKEHTKNWEIKNPLKRKAQLKVSLYMKSKNAIKKESCCVCSSNINLHYHHEDYNFPEKVYCLCVRCHANRHAGNIELDKSNEITLDLSNKRTKIYIDNNGIKYTISELSKIYGLNKSMIRQRYKRGLKFDEIIKIGKST